MLIMTKLVYCRVYATKRNRYTKNTTETWIHLPKIKVNEIKIILTVSSVDQSTQMTPQYNSGRYSSQKCSAFCRLNR